MTKNKHSIQKVFLEIDTNSMQMANSIKNNLAMFIKDELVPILEKQFNLIENTDNQIIQIEKLELSIQTDAEKNASIFSNSYTKIELKNQIEKEISKTINEWKNNLIPSEKNNINFNSISPEEKEIKTLMHFIEYGSMPWWSGKNDTLNFIEKINSVDLQKSNFKNTFQKLIHQKKVQKRIINQFSNTTIAIVLSSLLDTAINEKKITASGLLKLINNQSFEFKTSFWQTIFDLLNDGKTISLVRLYQQYSTLFTSKKVTFKFFVQNVKSSLLFDLNEDECMAVYKNIQMGEKSKSTTQSKQKEIEKQSNSDIKSNNSITKEDQNSIEINASILSKTESNQQNSLKETKEDFDENQPESKSIYVQNAGLIILHPFLKQVLKNCDLLDENNLIVNKELAAHILHYAATKKENDYEHTMLFEKFLCGIPLQQSIQREIKIEEKHKQNIEEMLQAVIQHWSALKNTSIDILRSEFLQREGKLDCTESNPKLTIERKTQDLLLEKIPWNINIVKIPWMEKLIYTQW